MTSHFNDCASCLSGHQPNLLPSGHSYHSDFSERDLLRDRRRTTWAFPKLEVCLIWGFPKIMGTLLGVPILGIIVFGGPYEGPLILGNCHIYPK